MLKSKSHLTCSFCSKIFKDPIELPCGDSICRKHLSERDVVKEKRIKCKECNEEFGVKGKQFQIDSSIHEVNRESMLSERRREKSQTKSGGVDS